MAESPRIAVIIPTHNRAELLGKVIDSILKQTIVPEIFVMDDACTDNTAEMVKQRYPMVRYYREEKSRGPTFQRNKAAEITSARYLFTIDDDCIFQSPGTIEQTIKGFDHPRVGAVTIPFINVLQDGILQSAAPDTHGIYATHDYFGGMIAIRRDVFLAMGAYRSYMFIQVEEQDLSVRMLNAGYVVRLGGAEPLHHMESPRRDHARRDMQGPRNHLLFAFYNVPWPYVPFRLTKTTGLCLIHGLRRMHLLRVIRGLGQGYLGMIHEWRIRKPVTAHTYRIMCQLKRRKSIPLKDIESMLPTVM